MEAAYAIAGKTAVEVEEVEVHVMKLSQVSWMPRRRREDVVDLPPYGLAAPRERLRDTSYGNGDWFDGVCEELIDGD